MMKTKFILPVFAMVLVLGLSNAAFAQLSCQVASTPVSRATDTGLTEPAGDIILNCAAGGTATTTATMTFDYGVPITNTTAYPTTGADPLVGASKPISITNISGFTGGSGTPSISAVTNSTGQIVVSIPGQPGTVASSFTLTGVLLAISGSGKTSVNANLSVSPGNNVLIQAGQTAAVVITSVVPGITAPKLATGTSAGLILGPGVAVPSTGGGFTIAVSENYIDMFRAKTQFNIVSAGLGGSTNGVQLLFTFTGVPTGVTFSGTAGSTTAPCTAALTNGGGATIVSTNSVVNATTNTILVEVTGTASLTAVDTLTLACPGATIGSTATTPRPAGPITATVTLAPTGTAFGSAFPFPPLVTVATGGQIPRYSVNQLPSPPLTVVNIAPAVTDMLFPFVSIGNGFDTGFSVANTTGDPFGTKAGGAVASAGTVTLYFYPNTGSSFCVTTGGTATNPTGGGTGAVNCTTLASTTVGTGLSSGGLVQAGSSWIVLGSQVLAGITGAPAVFNGYVFGIASFTNAHPLEFVADAAFSGKFASGGPALVLPVPSITSRVGASVVETLGH